MPETAEGNPVSGTVSRASQTRDHRSWADKIASRTAADNPNRIAAIPENQVKKEVEERVANTATVANAGEPAGGTTQTATNATGEVASTEGRENGIKRYGEEREPQDRAFKPLRNDFTQQAASAGAPTDETNNTSNEPAQTAQGGTAQQAPQLRATAAGTEEIIVDANDPRVKIRNADGTIQPLKQTVGEAKLVRKVQRTVSRLDAPAQLGRTVQQSSLLSQVTELVRQGVPEQEAFARVNQGMQAAPQQQAAPQAAPQGAAPQQAQPVAQPVQQATADPEPEPPAGFEPGDREYTAFEIQHALWQQRQQFQKTMAPLTNFVQSQMQREQARQTATQHSEQLEQYNKTVARTFTDYLPFEFEGLDQSIQKEVFERIGQAAEQRGFSFAQDMGKTQLTPAFLELVVRDAIPDDWEPGQTAESVQTAQTAQQYTQTQTPPQQQQLQQQTTYQKVTEAPLVPKAPPKPPFMPSISPLTTTAPTGGAAQSRESRSRSNQPSWVDKIKAR